MKEKGCVIKGTVRILTEGFLDRASRSVRELLGKKVKVHLVSLELDAGTQGGKVSREVRLRLGAVEVEVEVKKGGGEALAGLRFEVGEDFGRPGAVVVQSHSPQEFFLKSVTLELPDGTSLYFPCHSWISHRKFNARSRPRVFFSNQVYLPSETPAALVKLREEELVCVRGNGDVKEERKFGERIYEYDLYNDLCSIDKDKKLARSILGGSAELPYPRRCRTGRRRITADPAYELHISGIDDTYIPRDERFSPLKKRMFLSKGRLAFGHDIIASLRRLCNNDKSFKAMDEIHQLYAGGLKEGTTKRAPTDIPLTYFLPPAVVQENTEGWKTDHEFGRQRLAGANPFTIERLRVFPPVSELDPDVYGESKSSLTSQHLEPYLEGYTVQEAMDLHKLYILDFHDLFFPYLNRVNQTHRKTYASRTILYLTKDGVLLPIAIELSLPPKNKGEHAHRRVFTPNRNVEIDWVWHFAKTHAVILDMFLQLSVSHWLRTHCSMEPFIMATRRHLSKMHPVHVMLHPHFKDTMNLNASGRTTLVSADGRIERNFGLGEFSMEITSKVYSKWRFNEQSLPKDLLKRGLAVEDPSAKLGIRLAIEDHPFAADGLELWGAIHQWAKDYILLYYKSDKVLQDDVELQNWWKEITTVGHGDHAGAAWWVDMKKLDDLIEVVSTLIWLSSGHHACVNFAQYAYAGYMPNAPSMCRRFIPEEGTPEYEKMMADPQKFYFEMVPNKGVTTITMAMFESLAHHIEDEEYLGQRSDPQWTSDTRALAVLETFQRNVEEAEAAINARNASLSTLQHRAGPVKLPYTFLTPLSAGVGVTHRGVPNSISM